MRLRLFSLPGLGGWVVDEADSAGPPLQAGSPAVTQVCPPGPPSLVPLHLTLYLTFKYENEYDLKQGLRSDRFPLNLSSTA